MKIPLTNIHIITGGEMQKRIKAAASNMQQSQTRIIHNLSIVRAQLLFERTKLIQTINVLRKPVKTKLLKENKN